MGLGKRRMSRKTRGHVCRCLSYSFCCIITQLVCSYDGSDYANFRRARKNRRKNCQRGLYRRTRPNPLPLLELRLAKHFKQRTLIEIYNFNEAAAAESRGKQNSRFARISLFSHCKNRARQTNKQASANTNKRNLKKQ